MWGGFNGYLYKLAFSMTFLFGMMLVLALREALPIGAVFFAGCLILLWGFTMCLGPGEDERSELIMDKRILLGAVVPPAGAGLGYLVANWTLSINVLLFVAILGIVGWGSFVYALKRR